MTLDNYSQLFKALSEPMRLRIVHLLMQRDSLCVCDLVSVLNAGQSLISRHLAYLRNAGLVESYREGAWMHYRLLTEQLDILDRARFSEMIGGLDETRADLSALETYEQQERNCSI
ncbi:MAG: metalloregulator ArsR/SmtB family transcription factor [Hydrogenovibrio sp.]|nr:metalloregulator ArsR/SmtB family transcription factor [Hydrogenovibrio sp.]